MMKIGVVQFRSSKGDVPATIARHVALIDRAVPQGIDALFFPELSITGYEPTLAATLATSPDDARFDVFQQISDKNQLVIGVGMPIKQASGVCISMVIFQPQQARRLYSKQYLHADEVPFFTGGASSDPLIINGRPIALAICYELSVPEHTETACANGASVYVASVAKSVGGIDKALARLSEIAHTYSIPVLMANCVGEADGEECAGQTAIWNAKGERVDQLDSPNEGILILDLDTQEVSKVASTF